MIGVEDQLAVARQVANGRVDLCDADTHECSYKLRNADCQIPISVSRIHFLSFVQPKLILASASPRRKQLLGELGLNFDVVVAQVTEHEDPTTDPRVMVTHNAALKADWVAQRNPQAFVLGADTTVFIDNTVLNKPADLDEARAMLKRLSGRTHIVFTGVALRHLERGLRVDEGVSSEVTFKAFDDAVIDAYFRVVNPLDKAGAYGIQEGRELIIAGWKGSFSNIMGLPMEATKHILTQCGLLR